jgi:hypothetical protein
MSRRKRGMTGLMNERDFPHLVELALPPGGFRSVFLEFDAFQRQRRIPVRRGRSRHEAEQSYIRFCFPDAATADAFRDRFGGECLTYTAEKHRSCSRPNGSSSSTCKRPEHSASSAGAATRHRGRGDRIILANVRVWHFSDLARCPT